MSISNVGDVINAEYDRLKDKQASVDNALSGQLRLIQLNDSYRKRYSKYTQLVIIGIIALISFLIIISLPKIFPFIPSFLPDILLLILVVVIGFVVLGIYYEIQSRNITNYDEIVLPSEKISGNTNIDYRENSKNTAEGRDLSTMLNNIESSLCIGSQCCPNTWNADTNSCPNGFSTINAAYDVSNVITRPSANSSNIMPYVDTQLDFMRL